MEPKISPELLAIIQEEARKQAEAVYSTKGTQYGVADIPTHTHNGIDSVQLPYFSSIPTGGNGVLSPTQLVGVWDGASTATQFVNQGATGTPSLGNLVSVPIPVIQGSGTTFATTLTGSPSAGATSATLTGAWGGSTETVTSQFGDGEIRNVTFTNGSATVSWVGGLTFNPASTSLTQIADARFHGGSAPQGTAVVFVNTDDGLYQLWVRTDFLGGIPDLVNKWIGFTAVTLSP